MATEAVAAAMSTPAAQEMKQIRLHRTATRGMGTFFERSTKPPPTHHVSANALRVRLDHLQSVKGFVLFTTFVVVFFIVNSVRIDWLVANVLTHLDADMLCAEAMRVRFFVRDHKKEWMLEYNVIGEDGKVVGTEHRLTLTGETSIAHTLFTEPARVSGGVPRQVT